MIDVTFSAEETDITLKIKGHAGHPENERCDRLAVKMRDYYSAL